MQLIKNVEKVLNSNIKQNGPFVEDSMRNKCKDILAIGERLLSDQKEMTPEVIKRDMNKVGIP